MTRMLLAAVGVALAAPSGVQAQFFGPPPCPPGHHGGFAHAGFSIGGPARPVVGFASGYYARYAVVTPPYLPFFGWGPGFGPPYFLPPPAPFGPPFVPPIIVVGGEEDIPPPHPPPIPPAKEIGNPNAPRLKPNPPGEVIVINPRKPAADVGVAGEPGTISPKIDRVAPPPPLPKPAAFDPFAKPELRNVEKVEA